jgi:hypothetical protein
MMFHRPTTTLFVGLVLAYFGGTVPVFGFDKLSGVVQSVDLESKKLVVTPIDKEKPVGVLVDDHTELTTDSGKPINFKSLKAGDGVGIVYKDGLASKILVAVKPSELTGHVKSVGASLKSFVVTETGTTTDITVAITPETSFVTTAGKRLELKELKKGDGVGISHINSVASQVIVNVKPVEKETK